LEPGLARLLRHASGDDDDACAIEIGIVSRTNRQRVREWDSVINVVGLRLSAGSIQIDEHDLTTDAAHHERIGRCRSNHPTTNNANFHK
jgi:hypothetical protein